MFSRLVFILLESPPLEGARFWKVYKYTHAMPVYKFSRYKADTIMILSHVSVL